jgi:hypothetical protein
MGKDAQSGQRVGIADEFAAAGRAQLPAPSLANS